MNSSINNLQEAGPSLNKITKKTHKALVANDIHPNKPGKGDHYKYKCAHSNKLFVLDTQNRKQGNHDAKLNDIKKHRAAIKKPFHQ